MGGKIQIMQITLGEPESKIHKHTKTQKHKNTNTNTQNNFRRSRKQNTHKHCKICQGHSLVNCNIIIAGV